jgi:hypothetical protein
MIGFRPGAASRYTDRFLLVIAATLGLASAALGEGILAVNAPGTGSWVFDQPSVVANGSILQLAFVGDSANGADSPSLNTRLYYAAINAGADFSNPATVRTDMIVTAPVALESGDAYTNARHPHILLRTATTLLIVFQAVPAGETNPKIFRALVTVDGNAVKSSLVTEVRDATGGRIPGKLTDPSFDINVNDNTMRVAFSSYPSATSGAPYCDVYYARVGMDSARVVNNTILLTKTGASTGVSPLPRLKLDGNYYSDIIWAANNSDPTRTTPSGIYYSMVAAVSPSVVDNIAIGATQVLSGGYRWGFPNLILTGYRNVWILGVDEHPSGGSLGMAGSLGVSEVDPYSVTFDGNPVNVGNITNGSNISFFLNPPGGSILSSNYDTYQPEALLDTLNRVHITGYGFRYADGHGTPGRYFAMGLGTVSTGSGTSSVFSSMIISPVTVGTGDLSFAMQLPNDYTRPGFVHYNGKTVSFWSGPDAAVAGARDLYVTTTYSPTDPTSQSGCSTVDDPRGETGRIPGALALLLPAALLALRRLALKAVGR